MVVANDFLKYMNAALRYYRNKKRYGSICSYSYPVRQLKNYKKDVYVTRKVDCWGWGTWKDRCKDIDWSFSDFESYKKNYMRRFMFNGVEYGLDKLLLNQANCNGSSWAVIWVYHLFKNNLLSVYPRISRCKNIGMDGSGEHCEFDKNFDCELSSIEDSCEFEDLKVNWRLAHACAKFPKRSIKERLSSLLHRLTAMGEINAKR